MELNGNVDHLCKAEKVRWHLEAVVLICDVGDLAKHMFQELRSLYFN